MYVKSSTKGRSCFMLIYAEQTNLKNIKRVVRKDIFLLTLSQSKIYYNQSPALLQFLAANKRAGCPAGQLFFFFLSRPGPNVSRLRRPGAVRAQPCVNKFLHGNNALLVRRGGLW